MDPNSRNASVAHADVTDALLILREVIGRPLPAELWEEADQSAAALSTALVSGDGGAATGDHATRTPQS